MFKNRKVVRGIILAVLLLCTAYLVYSISRKYSQTGE